MTDSTDDPMPEPMTDPDGVPILDRDEAKAVVAGLFPNGWGGEDVLAELAPQGWAAAPLAAVFHPSVEQVYEESVRMHRNMQSFGRPDPDATPPDPEPTLDEIRAGHEETPVEPQRECQEVVGRCLWDVLSNNHRVTAADGRRLYLGSHRAAGGFLAELCNEAGGPAPHRPPGSSDFFDEFVGKHADAMPPEMLAQMRKEMVGDGGYTYLDFYMGSTMTDDRADLTPVYALIFRRLKAAGLDWAFHFPRMYLHDMRPLKEALDRQRREEEGEDAEPEFEGYDPSAAFAAEQEEQEHDEEVAEMRESLDEDYRRAVEAAKDGPPPPLVAAYRQVYGEWPEGWPPEA